MVSALDYESSSLDLNPGRGTAFCLWQDTLPLKVPLIVPLSTQVYKWEPGHFNAGVTLGWNSVPSRGEGGKKYYLSLDSYETGISSSLMCQLARDGAGAKGLSESSYGWLTT